MDAVGEAKANAAQHGGCRSGVKRKVQRRASMEGMELAALGAAPLRATARAGHLRVTDLVWPCATSTRLVTQTGSTTRA